MLEKDEIDQTDRPFQIKISNVNELRMAPPFKLCDIHIPSMKHIEL